MTETEIASVAATFVISVLLIGHGIVALWAVCATTKVLILWLSRKADAVKKRLR